MENHGPIESENKLGQGKRRIHPRYIYIRSTRQQIPVSEQVFQDYYRDINAYRRRMQEHKCCNCPPRCWLTCDMDCLTCPFHCGNEFLSLDAITNPGSDGDPITLGDTIQDDAPSIEEVVADKQLLDALFAELNELDPDMRQIVAQYEFRKPPLLTDEEIEEILGKLDDLTRWANEIAAYAQEAALNGKQWSGWKVVEGRSVRKYTDEGKVIAAAKAAGYHDIFRQSLLPITEMEKYMGKQNFQEVLGGLVHKPAGKVPAAALLRIICSPLLWRRNCA